MFITLFPVLKFKNISLLNLEEVTEQDYDRVLQHEIDNLKIRNNPPRFFIKVGFLMPKIQKRV